MTLSVYLSAFKHLVLVNIASLAILTSVYAHQDSTSGLAWEACEDKAKSTACKYRGAHNELYKGSCQIMSGHLMCVRNQPIEVPKTPAQSDHAH